MWDDEGLRVRWIKQGSGVEREGSEFATVTVRNGLEQPGSASGIHSGPCWTNEAARWTWKDTGSQKFRWHLRKKNKTKGFSAHARKPARGSLRQRWPCVQQKGFLKTDTSLPRRPPPSSLGYFLIAHVEAKPVLVYLDRTRILTCISKKINPILKVENSHSRVQSMPGNTSLLFQHATKNEYNWLSLLFKTFKLASSRKSRSH